MNSAGTKSRRSFFAGQRNNHCSAFEMTSPIVSSVAAHTNAEVKLAS